MTFAGFYYDEKHWETVSGGGADEILAEPMLGADWDVEE